MKTTARNIIKTLKNESNIENIQGMARFGISSKNVLGVPMPFIRALAGKTGKDHGLALELWDSGIHEAMVMATLTDIPESVTAAQMERWVSDFDSWAICDQCCSNLFDKTVLNYRKAVEWSRRKEEYVKRAGYVLMATLAVHDKKAPDSKYISFFSHIMRGAADDRNFVKKAVNWAIRQIGKRNAALNKAAIRLSEEILRIDSPSSRWIARDALRELKKYRP